MNLGMPLLALKEVSRRPIQKDRLGSGGTARFEMDANVMIAAARPGLSCGISPVAGVWTLVILASLGSVGVRTTVAVAAVDPELGIKVAMVYNTIRFVAWPPAHVPAVAAGERFRLGVEGDEDVLAAFMVLAGKPVGETVIEIVPVYKQADLLSCHLIYFQAPRAELIAGATGATLTVSDAAGFCREGGMVELVRDRNKIRFLVNPGAARARGLQFRSQLLKLATIVEDD